MVSKVEYDAFKAAIKDLRDADKTFERNEKVFQDKIHEKSNKEWLNTEEGQHLQAAFGKHVENMSKNSGSNSDSGDKK